MMAVALFAAGVAMTGCKNDNNNPQEPAKVQKYKMSITASKGAENNQANGVKKVLGLDGTGALNATWAAGERVTVYNTSKSAVLEGYLEAESNGASTQLTGELDGEIEVGDELMLKFLSPSYSEQEGTLAWIGTHCDYATASVTVASVSDGTITTTADADFVNQQAIVKFTLQDAGGSAISASQLVIEVGDNTYGVTLTSEASEVFVAIPGISGANVSIYSKAGGSWYSKEQAGVTFTVGEYYAITAKMNQTGTLPGKFSIGASSVIHFAQGNLQYVGTWQFAENQWEYYGTSQYDDHRDLFGWGTGNAPNKVSTNPSDYTIFTDWGTNAITNGGNEANMWRSLTKDEWVYLCNTRTNAANLRSKASVNDLYGFIFLSNDFVLPSGFTFTADATDWTTNNYSASEWKKIESAGAIFLPAAGDRYGSSDYIAVGIRGFYWASTLKYWNQGYTFYFLDTYLGPEDYYYLNYGRSVRMVR